MLQVRALLNEVKETQKEEERVFQELWDKAGDSEVRLRGLRPYKEQLEGKKETMASVSKLLSIALQFKTASG